MGAVCAKCEDGFGVEEFEHMTCVKEAETDSPYRCEERQGALVCSKLLYTDFIDVQNPDLEMINRDGKVSCRFSETLG
jgi:hypothetical protein